MRMHRNADRGFTLAEIMVVVVIIGILSAVAIPSYLTHIKRARQENAKSICELVGSAVVQTHYQRVGIRAATAAQEDGGWRDIGVRNPKDANWEFSFGALETDAGEDELARFVVRAVGRKGPLAGKIGEFYPWRPFDQRFSGDAWK